MDFQPTTRYPSLQLARHDARYDGYGGGYGEAGSSPVVIDGLDVVDEQVVLLSPLEPAGRGVGRGQPADRRTRYRGGSRDGMG
jgi:hypothetical protein